MSGASFHAVRARDAEQLVPLARHVLQLALELVHPSPPAPSARPSTACTLAAERLASLGATA